MRRSLREQLQPLRDSMPRRFWCDSKVRHASQGKAQAHVRALLRLNPTADVREYRCPTCLTWHVGNVRERSRDTQDARIPAESSGFDKAI